VVLRKGPLDTNEAYHVCGVADRFREQVVKSRQSWAELYAFEVDRALDAPVFRQIYLQLRSAILSGTLRPATKLPSTRELAAQLGVSRSAVVSAFEQLLAEGYASGKKGAGTYIAPDLPEPFGATHGRGKRPASAAGTAASWRDLGGFVDVTAQSDERPFNLGRTLVDARTAELWRKLSARTLRSFGRHHLGYADPHGMLELRKSVCEHTSEPSTRRFFQGFGSATPWCLPRSCPPSLPRAISWTATRRPSARRSSPPSWKKDILQLTSAGCGSCTATSGTHWSLRSGAVCPIT
jgi:DNA-binding transcriptional regulator YhcF (GntR family)